MGYKPTDVTLSKVSDDEPIFVLRAQDKLAPMVVRYWAELAEAEGTPAEKVDEAVAHADVMEAWPTRKVPD